MQIRIPRWWPTGLHLPKGPAVLAQEREGAEEGRLKQLSITLTTGWIGRSRLSKRQNRIADLQKLQHTAAKYGYHDRRTMRP